MVDVDDLIVALMNQEYLITHGSSRSFPCATEQDRQFVNDLIQKDKPLRKIVESSRFGDSLRTRLIRELIAVEKGESLVLPCADERDITLSSACIHGVMDIAHSLLSDNW